MRALIAGQGALPAAVRAAQDGPMLICALDHCPPDHVTADLTFRLETLGTLLRELKRRGVTTVCMCGAITRPRLSLARLDLATLPLLPRVYRALKRGDDGALRIAINIFESAGFKVEAAHEAAPDLLPKPGLWGRATLPEGAAGMAELGDTVSAEQGRADLGQACVLRGPQVLAREGQDGTDAMLAALADRARGGVLYKAPKPTQDRRADLPVIGPGTVHRAAEAGLRGLIIEAGGVMVLDQPRVAQRLEAEGLFLWIRPPAAPATA